MLFPLKIALFFGEIAFFYYKCGLQIPEFVKHTCRALVYSLHWRVTYGRKWLMPLECSPKLSERAYFRCQICHSLFDFHGDLVWWIGDIDAAFWIWVRLGHFFVRLPEAFDPRRWFDKYRLRNWEERTFLSPKIPVVESFGHSSAQLHVLKVVFADRYMCSLTMQNIH